jgi:hypothetical protein
MAHDGERPSGTRSRILIPATSTSAVAADLPEGPVREILVRASTGCHRAESFPAYGFTHDEYQSIVYRMAERGTQASSATVDQIRLPNISPGTFPRSEDPAKVNVNQAVANEIEAATRLPRARLQAMVACRERHPDFPAIGHWYVIYGVDGTKIQTAKDKVSF